MIWQSIAGWADGWPAWITGALGVGLSLWRWWSRRRGSVGSGSAEPWYRRWAVVGLAPLLLGLATIKLKARDETIRQLRAMVAEYEAMPDAPSPESSASSSGSGGSTPASTSPSSPPPSANTSRSSGSVPPPTTPGSSSAAP